MLVRYDIMELQEIGDSVGIEKEDSESWSDFVVRLREMYSRPILAMRHQYTLQRIDRIAGELNPRE